MTEPLALHPVSFSVRQTHPTKTIIARIWLVLGVLAVVMLAIPHFSQTSAHTCYYLRAVEYDTKIKIFRNMEDEEVIQSFSEGDDPDGYTGLGMFIIGMYPNTTFALFRPWMSSSGVSQISPIFSPSKQTLLTQSELVDLVLGEAALNLKSSDPFWEFERMQSTGFLKLIANNPKPITKFHPANIAADLLTLIFIAGAFWSFAYLYLVRQRAIGETACCSACGYSRDGLESITQCPECGQHFKIRTSENSM